MTQQAFLRYMSVLCGGEAAKYACEEAVKELEKQLAAIRDPYEPAMPDRDSVTRGVHLKKTEDMGGAGCVVAVILVFFITFLIDTNTQTGLDGSVVLAVLAVLAIAGVYKLYQVGTEEENKKQYEAQRESLWQTALSEHNNRLAAHRRECTRNEARRRTLRHMIAGYRTAQTQIERKLAAIYSAGIIPVQFRNLIAVHQIREYIEIGVCSQLKGPNGAFAQYLQDLRADKICSSIADMKQAMLRSLDRIAANQGRLLNEMRITNDNLSRFSQTVSASLNRIESNMDGLSHSLSVIGSHAAETNIHARNIEQAVRTSAYNNYIVQRYNNMSEYALVHALREPY